VQDGVVKLREEYTGYNVWRPNLAVRAGLIEFMSLFFSVFEGLALRYDKIGKIFVDFTTLPETELRILANQLGIDEHDVPGIGWETWLDKKGRTPCSRCSLHPAGHTFSHIIRHNKPDWFYLNNTGKVLHGLKNHPQKPTRTVEFRALPNLCVFAGTDVSSEKLITLFHYTRIKKIDRIFEFQLDGHERNAVQDLCRQGTQKKRFRIWNLCLQPYWIFLGIGRTPGGRCTSPVVGRLSYLKTLP
jgi:hypothetical protein